MRHIGASLYSVQGGASKARSDDESFATYGNRLYRQHAAGTITVNIPK